MTDGKSGRQVRRVTIRHRAGRAKIYLHGVIYACPDLSLSQIDKGTNVAVTFDPESTQWVDAHRLSDGKYLGRFHRTGRPVPAQAKRARVIATKANSAIRADLPSAE